MSTQLNMYSKWNRVLGNLGMNKIMKGTELADASHRLTSYRAKNINKSHVSNLVRNGHQYLTIYQETAKPYNVPTPKSMVRSATRPSVVTNTFQSYYMTIQQEV